MANKLIENIPKEKRSPGRPKGSLNKTTATAKSIIEETAEALGGAKRMTEWAKEAPENERAFWTTIYPKLLPMQVTGDASNPVAIITREIVAPKS
jgi:hypothetical protein